MDQRKSLTLPATTMLNPYVDKDIEDKQYKISMQGQEVFKFAVRTITSNIDFLLNKTGLTKEDIDYIIPHQANLRIIEQAENFVKYL